MKPHEIEDAFRLLAIAMFLGVFGVLFTCLGLGLFAFWWVGGFGG